MLTFDNENPEMKMLIKIKAERAVAERKAFKALAGYKFYMFGYWAAAWVKYNALLPNPMKAGNPFKLMVREARHELGKEGYEMRKLEEANTE